MATKRSTTTKPEARKPCPGTNLDGTACRMGRPTGKRTCVHHDGLNHMGRNDGGIIVDGTLVAYGAKLERLGAQRAKARAKASAAKARKAAKGSATTGA